MDDPINKAIAIRMDWSENATLFQCRQEKSAYYHDIQVSVNTVVMYTEQGVISVSAPNKVMVGTLLY